MTASAILAESERRGIKLCTRAGKLVVDAPRGSLDDAFRADLVGHRAELLRLFDPETERLHEVLDAAQTDNCPALASVEVECAPTPAEDTPSGLDAETASTATTPVPAAVAAPLLTPEDLVGPLWREAREAMRFWSRGHRLAWEERARDLEDEHGLSRLEADKTAFLELVYVPQRFAPGERDMFG